MTKRNDPAPDYDAIASALALDGDDMRTLREQALGDPPRGVPLTVDGMAVEPGAWRGICEDNGLPPLCPVKPLGMDKAGAWFLNPMGQVVCLSPSASGKGPIDFLFAGRTKFLEWAWPRWTGEGEKRTVKGYEADEARRDLVDACAYMGAFDDTDRLRGRGAWTDEFGKLIYHAGDRVFFNDRWRAPGEHGDWVFPARRAVMTPDPRAIPDGEGSPADVVLETFRTWNFDRGELDARLLLGWVAAAMIGGALDWRPLVFLSGDQETGKSTLQKLIKALLGGLLVQSVNPTAAGIYQKVQHDSAPVSLDEFEADADTRKADAIVMLARQAASGGLLLRGGSDHNGKEFQARSAFIFSAINRPPLNSQDQSRIADLALRPLAEMRQPGEGPVIAPPLPEDPTKLGRQLMRRMMDGWTRFPRTLRIFKTALMEAGHSGRAGDQFGTLATAFHVAMWDRDPEAAELDWWKGQLKPSELAETASITPNWKQCLMFLVDAQPDALRNHSGSIRSLGDALELYRKNSTDEDLAQVCKKLGVAVSWPEHELTTWDHARLFIPSTHPAVMKVFEGSQWAGKAGAAGVWASALRQAPKDVAFNGVCGKGLDKKRPGIFIQLAKVFGD